MVLFLTLVSCQSSRQPTQTISEEPITSRNIEMPRESSEKSSNKVKVAMLLPLSGEHHILGDELLNAAQLSVFENSGDNIELLVFDTKGDPSTAANVAAKAASQGAKLFIGPVFANEASAVKQVAGQSKIPVISLSNNQNIAQAPLFTFGFGHKDQIWKLAQVARQNGIMNLGAFVPKSEYGYLIKGELEEATQANNMPKPYVAEYDNATFDFSKYAQSFKNANVKGIIIPEGGQKLRLIISGLVSGDLTGVKFLGTGQWDTPDVNFDGTLLGGWFVSSPVEPRLNFESRYEKMFGKTPKRIATLAYDAVSLAIKAADGDSGQINYGLMTDQRGFSGVDGVFKLLPSGQVERDLAVYEITESGLKKIS